MLSVHLHYCMPTYISIYLTFSRSLTCWNFTENRNFRRSLYPISIIYCNRSSLLLWNTSDSHWQISWRLLYTNAYFSKIFLLGWRGIEKVWFPQVSLWCSFWFGKLIIPHYEGDICKPPKFTNHKLHQFCIWCLHEYRLDLCFRALHDSWYYFYSVSRKINK